MDAQYTATAGDLISVLGVPRVLFKIAGQAAVSVRGGAEGGLDTPAERQWREAGGPGFARGYLEIDLMAFCDGIHGGAGIDGIDLDVLGCELVLGRAFQEEIRRPGVMDVGRGDEYRQHQAQRAGQDRALDPLDLLVAVETALAFLRPGHDALRVHDDGRRFRRVPPRLADPPRQQSGRIRPDAIGPEAVMPRANRLPGAEILRKRPPLATGVFQVKTGIHHLPDVRGVGQVVRKQRLYGRPLHIRQVARIPPPVILVLLAIFGRPHADLPSRITNSRRRVSVKQALQDIEDLEAVVDAFCQRLRNHVVIAHPGRGHGDTIRIRSAGWLAIYRFPPKNPPEKPRKHN